MIASSTTASLRSLTRAPDARPAPSTGVPSDEPALFYAPPYASPTLDRLAWHLVKYLDPACGLRDGVDSSSVAGLPLGIDLLIEHRGRRVGLMCGAPEALRPRWHDALLMGRGAVDVLYRLRPEDVENHLHDALWLAFRWDRTLFSERGRINLRTLATPTARDARPRPIDTVVRLRYDEASGTAPLPSEACRVQRLSQRHPDGWMPVYEQAREALGLDPALQRQWVRRACA